MSRPMGRKRTRTVTLSGGRPASVRFTPNALNLDGEGLLVGVNVSGLLYMGGYTGRNMFALACDYPALARALVGHFAGLPGCQVHLIGHVNSHHNAVEDDYRVAERLDITRNNLKVRHHRARQQLRERLEETCRTCATHGCIDCTCASDAPALHAH